eukprot:XP_003963293.1 PREDICTED: phosphatase and actin regulator 3 [Takifugu rubripes]
MASSDGLDGCLQRGRSQSDPNILTEPGIDLAHGTELVDQQRVLRSGCLVTGVHTPPIRRNSKLASLGRIFKPWKWRKKKNEKLKQSSTDVALSSSLLCHDPNSPTQGCCSDGTILLGGFGGPLHSNLTVSSVEYLGPDEDHPSPAAPLHDLCDRVDPSLPDEDRGEEVHPAGDLSEVLQDMGEQTEDRAEEETPPGTSPPQVPPKVLTQLSVGDGSPHLGNMMHPPMPPSCIMEELQRAFASKNRQESGCAGGGGSDWPKKEAEENKENVRLDQCFSNTSGLPIDLDGWNESVISGTLPRRLRKELLAVKLRNRPSKQELEDRNIFPARSDQERQEIRQQIEMKLAKRLSQRPNVEELESRNILKQRNDQTEQEERREIKQRLNRKLNQRPTVDELRDRKILIRFSDYVEVAKAQDYDRRADKPWTRLSAADKAAIRKELNEFKSTEMEVHASSKHLTRFHRP